MSGGVGPTGDSIRLPDEELEVAAAERRAKLSSDPSNHARPATDPSVRRRFFSFRQLNALAAAIVLSATGMVSVADAIFAAFSLLYLYVLSSSAFPPTASPSADEPIFGRRNLLLAAHVSVGALLGLVLPIAYIVGGVVESDKEGIKAAVPHVFLLSSQVFVEGVAASRRFSPPLRAFVPVFFNAKRMFALGDWVRAEAAKAEGGEHGGSGWRIAVGQGLAVANLVFWALNLFAFLIPVYLPMSLKRYYSKDNDNNKNNKLNKD